MCTVSWFNQPDGYTLFFNRDESRSRPEATPPRKYSVQGINCLCPQDPEGEGTWLLANEHGITLGLLNYYEARVDYQPPNRMTRGKLPLRFAHCRSLSQVNEALGKTDLTPYPPFHLLAVAGTGEAGMHTWDGTRKHSSQPHWPDLPITTSSHETQKVVHSRKAQFKDTVWKADDPLAAMERYHSSKKPAPESFAVLMARPDARTVSVSRIHITASTVEMRYQARTNDTEKLDKPITIQLSRSGK